MPSPVAPMVRFLVWFTFGAGALVCSKNPPLDPTQIPTDPVVVLVSLQSLPERLAPGESAVVQARLVDDAGRPAANQTVRFSTTHGSVQPVEATTDTSGWARATFTAPQQDVTVELMAQYGTQSRTVTIEVKNASAQAATIAADDEALLANGVSSTVIRTLWKDEDGRPLKGIPVTFSATVGTLTDATATDSFGVATAKLVSPALSADTLAVVTASAAQKQVSTQVRMKGIAFTLEATPQNLIADGRSEATLTAVLKEATSNLAISDATVQFAVDLGTIPNTAVTNSSGVARVSLTSATTTGTATVTAWYGDKLERRVQVLFARSVPTFLTVSAEPTVIPADNQSTATITAVVSDQDNNPVPDGTAVNFEIVDGSGTIESHKVTSGGVATSTLTSSTQPDTVRVVARVDQLSDSTTVYYVVGPPAAVTVVADSSSLPADGMTSTRVVAHVSDAAGHPVVDGTRVNFTTDLGEITPTAQTVSGQAVAQFSSGVTGVASIRATVGDIFGETTIELRPGPPNSILLTFDPNTLGVKDSGRNQSLTITAAVVDSKNNAVVDGTFVRFSIFSGPGGGEFLSSTEPVPTLNGQAQVSLNSGIRSGSVRIMAEVTDATGTPVTPEVRAVSTEIIIFAGPPFIEDVNNPASSHLTVGVQPLNVLGWNVVNNTAVVTAVVGDKFNNPVPAGTAVFFTTTGGVISTYTGFTNEEGLATVILHTAQPYPDVTRYYNTFEDPNAEHPAFNKGSAVIPGPIPDFEGGEVVNSLGDVGENDGVARILAVTEGVDASGNSARVWSVADLVFSGRISVFEITVSDTVLSPGESALITFRIYDENGNPIVPGSEISLASDGGRLSWSSLITDDPGVTRYQVLFTNNLDPTDPDARPVTTPVTVSVSSPNGNLIKDSKPISLILN